MVLYTFENRTCFQDHRKGKHYVKKRRIEERKREQRIHTKIGKKNTCKLRTTSLATAKRTKERNFASG